MIRNRKFKFWHALVLLLLFLFTTVFLDSIGNSKFESIPERPDPDIPSHQNELYFHLVNDTANPVVQRPIKTPSSDGFLKVDMLSGLSKLCHSSYFN